MDRQIRNAERYAQDIDGIQAIKCRGGQHAWDAGHLERDGLRKNCWKCPATDFENLEFITTGIQCLNCITLGIPWSDNQDVRIPIKYPNHSRCFTCGFGWIRLDAQR